MRDKAAHVEIGSRGRPATDAPPLRAHGVWTPLPRETHAELAAVLASVAASRPGFIDPATLPKVRSLPKLVISDGSGNLSQIDTSGTGFKLNPLMPSTGTGRDQTDDGAAFDQASAPGTSSDGAGKRSSGAAIDLPHELQQLASTMGNQLAGDALAALFAGKSLGPELLASLDASKLLSGLSGAALQGVQNLLMGSFMSALFGGVNDASSVGAQLAAKFAPQLLGEAQDMAMNLADQAMSGQELGAGMKDKAESFFFGVKSAASIPLGKAAVPGGAKYILLEGGEGEGPRALKVTDLAQHCDKPPRPFIQGHPTILINGQQAVGMGHKATCGCGQPVMPKVLATSVLMGKPPAPPPSQPEEKPSEKEDGGQGKGKQAKTDGAQSQASAAEQPPGTDSATAASSGTNAEESSPSAEAQPDAEAGGMCGPASPEAEREQPVIRNRTADSTGEDPLEGSVFSKEAMRAAEEKRRLYESGAVESVGTITDIPASIMGPAANLLDLKKLAEAFAKGTSKGLAELAEYLGGQIGGMLPDTFSDAPPKPHDPRAVAAAAELQAARERQIREIERQASERAAERRRREAEHQREAERARERMPPPRPGPAPG